MLLSMRHRSGAEVVLQTVERDDHSGADAYVVITRADGHSSILGPRTLRTLEEVLDVMHATLTEERGWFTCFWHRPVVNYEQHIH